MNQKQELEYESIEAFPPGKNAKGWTLSLRGQEVRMLAKNPVASQELSGDFTA